MTTLTNHHPPAAAGCGLNHPTICREESDTPHVSPTIAATATTNTPEHTHELVHFSSQLRV